MEIEGGLAGVRPKDGLDGYSSDKSEFDYAASHNGRYGQKESEGVDVELERTLTHYPFTR